MVNVSLFNVLLMSVSFMLIHLSLGTLSAIQVCCEHSYLPKNQKLIKINFFFLKIESDCK